MCGLVAACQSGADHAGSLRGIDPVAKSDALVYFMEQEGPTGLEKETRDVLRDTLRAERNPLVRAQAAQALGRSKFDPEYVEWLLATLEREQAHVVRFDVVIALTALGRSCDAPLQARVGKEFGRRLTDVAEHPWVKLKAARGLGELRLEAEIPALVAALGDQDYGVRLNAHRALVAITRDKTLEANQADWQQKYPTQPAAK